MAGSLRLSSCTSTNSQRRNCTGEQDGIFENPTCPSIWPRFPMDSIRHFCAQHFFLLCPCSEVHTWNFPAGFFQLLEHLTYVCTSIDPRPLFSYSSIEVLPSTNILSRKLFLSSSQTLPRTPHASRMTSYDVFGSASHGPAALAGALH